MTKKLKILVYLSVPLLIAHSLEEYLTDFYNWSPIFKDGFAMIIDTPILTFLVMMWVAFVLMVIMTVSEKWRLYMVVLPALLFTFELHHWIEFFIAPQYKGGDMTAIIIPAYLYFYWKEWWQNLKTAN